jgi:hypothetical protein
MSPLTLPLLYYFFGCDARRIEEMVMATVLDCGQARGLLPVTSGAGQGENG